MENNKSKLKGFTLIELIIVLAIFSGLMVLIMSFIDPVSRQMTDTSIRERTAAYVDNVSDYIDGSIRHSKFIKVYEKGYCASDLTVDIKDKDFAHATTSSGSTIDTGLDNYDVAAGRDERWLAVRDFVDDYFDGAVKETVVSAGAASIVPIKGKVHVLEILNDDTVLYNPDTNAYDINGKAGEIYETVYDFTAGNSIADNTTGATIAPRIFNETNCYKSVISANKGPISVINPEHFQNYSYYYKLGMYSLEPVLDSDLQEADLSLNQYVDVATGSPLPVDPNANYYYSQLQPLAVASAADPDMISDSHFTLNVVAYQQNDASSNKFYVTQDDPAVAGATKTVPVFRSPAYMNSTSMALLNVIEASKVVDPSGNKKTYSYYSIKQQDKGAGSAPAGSYLDESGNAASAGDAAVEPLTTDKGMYDMAFAHRVSQAAAHAGSSNIYIVYAVPSEIQETDMT